MVRRICGYIFLFILFSCNSEKSSENKNPESFLSFYNNVPKNDSLKIEIDYDRSKDHLGICMTNMSDKDIIVPHFQEVGLYPSTGFVFLVYEKQDDDYVEMPDAPDYDVFRNGDTIMDRKLVRKEKCCDHSFSPDALFEFSRGKTYKLVVRYYAEYAREHHDKFIESNIVTVKWE
jgi:hypothetical protein